MGFLDKIKDAANTASDMVAKANELVDKSEAAIGSRMHRDDESGSNNAREETQVARESASSVGVSSGEKAQGMFDQSGYLLIHDEDQLVDSMYFPNPTDIDEDEILDYFEEQNMFAENYESDSGEFWAVRKVQYSFDEDPGVVQGEIVAFIPAAPSCHAFYGVLYVDDDGDLRFDMRRQHNPAAVVTRADAARYDTLKKAVDGLLQTDELFGWTYGAGKRLVEPAYYDQAEVSESGSQAVHVAGQSTLDRVDMLGSTAAAQTAPSDTRVEQVGASAARALAVIDSARRGMAPYVPEPSKDKRYADLKAAAGLVKNHFLQASEGFKLMSEVDGGDIYTLMLDNARGDVQYTIVVSNRAGSTSLSLTAMICAGVLQDDVSELDLHRVFDDMYRQTLLSFFGPARLCPQVNVGPSGERQLIVSADVWFTSEIRRLNDTSLFASSEYVVPTLLANRIDVMEVMFHDALVTATLAALCK